MRADRLLNLLRSRYHNFNWQVERPRLISDQLRPGPPLSRPDVTAAANHGARLAGIQGATGDRDSGDAAGTRHGQVLISSAAKRPRKGVIADNKSADSNAKSRWPL